MQFMLHNILAITSTTRGADTVGVLRTSSSVPSFGMRINNLGLGDSIRGSIILIVVKKIVHRKFINFICI